MGGIPNRLLFFVIVLLAAGQAIRAEDDPDSRTALSRLEGQPMRLWHDDSGFHRVSARLVEVSPQHVRLLKANQRITTVPRARLSDWDRAYVTRIVQAYRREPELNQNDPTPARAAPRSRQQWLARHAPWGVPAGAPLIVREAYVVAYDNQRGLPAWVAYHAQADRYRPLAQPPVLRDDPDLPSAARVEDYRGVLPDTGYGPAPLVPGDLMGSDMPGPNIRLQQAAMMGNIAPMHRSGFTSERGLWGRLQNWVQELLLYECDELWIVSGCVFGRSPLGHVGNQRRVEVPTAYFQLIVAKPRDPNHVLDVAAFVLPHQKRPRGNLRQYMVSVDVLESLTGLDFLSELDDDTEAWLEALVDPTDAWHRSLPLDEFDRSSDNRRMSRRYEDEASGYGVTPGGGYAPGGGGYGVTPEGGGYGVEGRVERSIPSYPERDPVIPWANPREGDPEGGSVGDPAPPAMEPAPAEPPAEPEPPEAEPLPPREMEEEESEEEEEEPAPVPANGGGSHDVNATTETGDDSGFEPAPSVRETGRVEVFYGTDREIDSTSTSPYTFYSGNRGQLHFGVCEVRIPPDKKEGEIPRPKWYKLEFHEDPKKHMIMQRPVPLEEDAFVSRLQTRVKQSPEKEAFIFIHGYNNSFADAALRTAQIAYDLDFSGAPIMFSWPSKKRLIQYTYDRNELDWAEPHLEQFLTLIADRSEAKKIHIIAHSMGNDLLKDFLVQCATWENAPRFHEIILAAPDVDAQVFKENIAPNIAKAGQRLTLYVSERDKALTASLATNGQVRLGGAISDFTKFPFIDQVDATSVDTSVVGHAYFGSTSPLLQDIAGVLQGRPPLDRKLKQQSQGYFTFPVGAVPANPVAAIVRQTESVWDFRKGWGVLLNPRVAVVFALLLVGLVARERFRRRKRPANDPPAAS